VTSADLEIRRCGKARARHRAVSESSAGVSPSYLVDSCFEVTRSIARGAGAGPALRAELETVALSHQHPDRHH
jgi:hypothetical protein